MNETINIVLIEDNPGDIRLIEELLKYANNFYYNLIIAKDLTTGFKKIEKYKADVILLDLTLPDCMGINTIIKTRNKVKNLPIVVLTGIDDEIIARKAVQAGAQEFLIKGTITGEILARSIIHAIDRQKMKQTIEVLAETVQRSQDQLRKIIDGNADGIVIINNQGIVQFVNRAAEKLFDRERMEFLDHSFGFPISLDNKTEIKIHKKNGRIIHAEMNSAKILWENSEAFLITIRDISIRKEAEDKIKNIAKFPSENPNPVLRVKNGHIIYANPAAKRRFNLEKGEAIPNQLRNLINNSMMTRTNRQKEIQFNKRFYSLTINPIPESNYVNVYAMDITDRKIAELALKESEMKYKTIIEHSASSIVSVNRNGVFLIVNKKAAEDLGGSPEDFIGKSLSEVFPSEEAEKRLNSTQKIFKTGIGNSYEETYEYITGNKTYLVNEQPLKDLSGNIYAVQSIALDITELKESEKIVRRLEQTLHEMNALIEHAPMAIFLIDKSGKILRANEAAKDLLEYDDELLNHKILNIFDPKYLETAYKHFNEDIYDLNISNSFEASLKTKTGKHVDVEITSTIIKIAENLIIQSFFSNISERKNYERHREMLLDELISSLEFKSMFLATVSHELRTPLNAILGFSSLLLEDGYGETTKQQKGFLKDIYQAGDHLLNLINSILDLSKIDAGKLELDIKSFELFPLVQEIQSIIKPLYTRKNLEFKIEGISEKTLISADSLRFKQVLYNLVDNSIKFTDEGHIKLKLLEKNDHWEFQIEDSGIGIADEDKEIVFREFGRVENDKLKPVAGSGLGLAVTKRIINLHGGKIWFKSKFGKGTTFYFTIPKLNKSYEKDSKLKN
jgi:PAS domain S-box-containing protein